MKISLIIPIFNQARAFECVLESIKCLNYSKSQYEVIVIEDGSTEMVKTHVEKYYKQINIKYIRHENNKGRSAARNTGASVAEGDILIFTDGDRVLSPDFINEHEIQSKSNTVCIGKVAELFKTIPKGQIEDYVRSIMHGDKLIDKFIFNYPYQETVFSIYDETGNNRSNIPWISLLSGNFSILKSDYQRLGGFDEHFKSWGLENIEFGYRIFASGMKFVYNKNAVNYHLYHDINRRSNNMRESIMYFYTKYKDVNIKKYYDFIDGQISLKEIDFSLDEVFFRKSKIGSRYIRGY